MLDTICICLTIIARIVIMIISIAIIEFSLGGSNAYISPDKKLRINIHKQNNKYT